MRAGFCFAAFVSALLFALPARATDPLIIVTASPGGSYYPYGKGLASLLTKYVGVAFTAEATQGPVQNILLLEEHKAVLGMVTMGVAREGWDGVGWASGKQRRSIRAVFPMFDSPFHFATPRGKIASLSGISGQRIGAGPKAGTAGTYMPRIFDTLGISAIIRNGAWATNIQQLASGDLDGLAIVGGVPLPELAALDRDLPLDYVQPSSDEISLVKKMFPELSISVIPAGTYPSLTTDYNTFGLYNFAVVDAALPDDLVYKIVKTVFEHRQELEIIHSAAKETLAANVDRNTFLPFHPGALRYYREIGAKVPDALSE